jgi:hypothetical protein
MTRHQLETELSDIRREITRLQRRQAQLLQQDPAEETGPRPGWPMLRADPSRRPQASGAMSSTSSP